jgi:hypothetical protein
MITMNYGKKKKKRSVNEKENNLGKRRKVNE